MQRLENEFRQIGELQRHMVGGELPQPRGWRTAAYYSVGTWPGGDYYDLRELPDGRLSLVIADASGHGGVSAVIMAMIHTIIHTCPLSSGDKREPFCPLHDPLVQTPDKILGHLNDILAENTLDHHFATAFVCAIEPATGVLQYACAGHPLPRLWRAAPRTATTGCEGGGGIPLGIQRRTTYACHRALIAPLDILVFYTDGLVEARNDQGEFFGVESIDNALTLHAQQGADAVRDAIMNSLRDFLGGTRPDDDITLLVLERLAPARVNDAVKPREVRLHVLLDNTDDDTKPVATDRLCSSSAPAMIPA